jgi:hypothetical protein
LIESAKLGSVAKKSTAKQRRSFIALFLLGWESRTGQERHLIPGKEKCKTSKIISPPSSPEERALLHLTPP